MLNNNGALSFLTPTAQSIGAAGGVFSGEMVEMFYPASGTVAMTGNTGALTTSSTISHVITSPTAADFTKFRRQRVASAAAATSTAALYRTFTRYSRGTGFQARSSFSLFTNVTGFQMLIGMSTNLGVAIGGEPSATVNCVGIGFDSTDSSTGNFFVIHNDGTGTATKVDTGVQRNTTEGYFFDLVCIPQGNILWQLTNMISGAAVGGTLATDLPVNTINLAYGMRYATGAITSSATFETTVIGISTQG